MKGYGLPRNDDVAHPDVGDIQQYGRKSSVGKFAEKCGKYKSYTRNSKSRKAIRRYWKKRIRQKLKWPHSSNG